MKKKNTTTISLVIILVLSCVFMIGSTIALLKDSTPTITNTFRYGGVEGKVSLELIEPAGEEMNYQFAMAPGITIEKDPTIVVLSNSENSYVFVRIDESENFENYLQYTIEDGWIPLNGEQNVYYREYTKSSEDVNYNILLNNEVTVSRNIRQSELEQLESNYPTLTFTVYAVQNNADPGNPLGVNDAWNIVNSSL